MTRCTEYVPTVVEARQVHEEIPACHRHIVTSAGNGGFWTLCGQWIPLRRLRVLRVDHSAGTMQVREEEQQVEPWDWWDCHRACALEHLRRKQQYRIGTGWWSWLWHSPMQVPSVVTVDEAKQRLAALEAALKAPRVRWWWRWFRRKEKAA